MGLLKAVLVFALAQVCYGGGKFELKLKRFTTGCKEHAGASNCDIYFKFCLESPGTSSCNYLRRETGVWEDTSTINFGTNMKGVQNPMVVSVNPFQESTVEFSAQIWEEDFWTSDDHIDTLSRSFTQTPVLYKYLSDNSWKSDYFYKGHHHMWVAYRLYCNADYYTSACNVYCKAQNSPALGYYTCDEATGQKVCLPGWTGPSCTVDVNECSKDPCYNGGTCVNTPGSFSCQCAQHFSGQYCDQISSLCHSSPCKNGGSCDGDTNSFTCTCPPAWTGNTCEEQVDFCEDNPCQNNATCYGVIGNYTCECDVGWTGPQCQTEVLACESSPCQNGATCQNLPREQYNCVCPQQFKGDDCETEKNPCEPNPCQNSGECNKLSYDQFSCTCITGWTGADCAEYIQVEIGAQTQTEEKTDNSVDWWVIVVACCFVVLLAGVIFIAVFVRRRRQKKALQEATLSRRDHIVQVAGPDNMAFQNALYNQMNRTNSQIDRRNTPVPPTPDEDIFNPVKPKFFPDEEEGAVGGVPHQYAEVGDGYLQPRKLVTTVDEKAQAGTETKQKTVDGYSCLDTRAEAGAIEGKEVNHYADFEELKRRSIAARQNSSVPELGNPNYDTTGDGVADPDALQRLQEEEEVNHYSDLEDVFLQIQNRDGTAAYATHPSNRAVYATNPSNRPLSMDLPAPTPPEELDTSDDEDEAGLSQEDIDALRRQVLEGQLDSSHSKA